MANDSIQIRSETEGDYDSIYLIHQQAFGQNNESELISILRKTAIFDPRLSLIAFKDHEAVGHILFYPLNIEIDTVSIKTLGLVPLAVKSQFQNQGIGSRLIEDGLKRAKELDYESAFVVGDPNYYQRFGFSKVKDITNNIGVSQDHFMAIELVPESLKNIQGNLIYPSEFDVL